MNIKPIILYLSPTLYRNLKTVSIKLEQLLDKYGFPYIPCYNLVKITEAGITRIPVAKLPSGELLTYKQFLDRLDELLSLYNLK